MRRRSSATSPRASTESMRMNHEPAATALHRAARMLSRAAYDTGIGINPKACAIMTNSGLPGGCGSPRTLAAAMYSLVSHIAVVGDSVTRYKTNTHSAASAPQAYGGVCGAPVLTSRVIRIPFLVVGRARRGAAAPGLVRVYLRRNVRAEVSSHAS